VSRGSRAINPFTLAAAMLMSSSCQLLPPSRPDNALLTKYSPKYSFPDLHVSGTSLIVIVMPSRGMGPNQKPVWELQMSSDGGTRIVTHHRGDFVIANMCPGTYKIRAKVTSEPNAVYDEYKEISYKDYSTLTIKPDSISYFLDWKDLIPISEKEALYWLDDMHGEYSNWKFTGRISEVTCNR
jgi:hypothetical protein